MTRYKAFIRVAELGSMTAAARELGYSQPSISHMLAGLEKEMGFALLQKKRGRMELTEDGRTILKYCYMLERDERALADAAAGIRGMVSGSIRIGALNSMLIDFLPRIVGRFSDAYSNIELTLREYAQEELKEALLEGRIDIGLMMDDVPKGFDFYSLFRDPICLLMREDHLLASYKKVPIDALNGCDFIMPAPGWDDLVLAVKKRRSFSPVVRHQTASDTAAISMAAKGLGVCIVSRMQTTLLPEGVVYRGFAEDVARNMGVCVRSRAGASPAQREFIGLTEHAAAVFQEKLL